MPRDDATPNVFTIPAGRPFVDVLAQGLRSGVGGEPLALARVTVLVPTRRARRSLAEAFLRQGDGRPLLLPRLVALGDMDEDEALFFGGDGGADVGGDLAAAPAAISGLRRRLLLARQVMARPDVASPEQAVNLAAELGALLDQVETERLGFDRLEALVPEDLAGHWRKTLEFLAIVTENWPAILAEEGAVDAARRRNQVFEAQARAWEANPPADPVIAAGSTGSIPATADLMAVVARLPQGCVVLPGLDLDATDEAWAEIGEHHPQYLMARLLGRLGVERRDVRPWPAPGSDAGPTPRGRLIGRALTPAGAEAPRKLRKKELDAALSGVERIDCPGPAEEAAVIALVMRRTLDTPSRTAALVTPDRALARRVAAALGRWGLAVDDSAGQPLAQASAGAFLRLTARMVAERLAPVPLLAALKHPLAAAGMAAPRFRARVRLLEKRVLRGPRPGPGFAGLRAALAAPGFDDDGEARPAEGQARNKEKADLGRLLDDLEARVAPLAGVLTETPAPLVDVVTAHLATAEALAADDQNTGAARLWAGDAGEQAARFTAELIAAAEANIAVTAGDYPALLESLMRGAAVRPRFGRHPRLHIWGLLEARLQQADVMILGGLNEGTWPPEVRASPWMSRPMLKAFGLPAPERHLGQTAHDFQQAFAAPEVVLTRAIRVDGTPQVAARWLLRVDNALAGLGRAGALAAKEPWLKWAAALDAPGDHRPVPPPRPTPPVKARPRTLSVTRIEALFRDPYAIYARYVLGLKKLDPIDAEAGAAERGTIVHAVLDGFHKALGNELPDDAERKLLEIGRHAFDHDLARPGIKAFWWPRFERIAKWYVANERRRRDAGYRVLAGEVRGAMTIDAPGGPFTLTARADRIDATPTGDLSIIDYKTGKPPTEKEVAAHYSPQLPLEAAIAETPDPGEGFEGIEHAQAAELVYHHVSGGRIDGAENVLDLDVAETVAETRTWVAGLIADYDDKNQPYLSQPRPKLVKFAGDYDHLARIKEWRGLTGDDE